MEIEPYLAKLRRQADKHRLVSGCDTDMAHHGVSANASYQRRTTQFRQVQFPRVQFPQVQFPQAPFPWGRFDRSDR
jgi:hypothetical protein